MFKYKIGSNISTVGRVVLLATVKQTFLSYGKASWCVSFKIRPGTEVLLGKTLRLIQAMIQKLGFSIIKKKKVFALFLRFIFSILHFSGALMTALPQFA